MMKLNRIALASLLLTSPVLAQTTSDPLPDPITAGGEAIVVNYVEFATLPDIEGAPARMMRIVAEPGTGRMFVNDMRGPLYSVSYDGQSVEQYIDTNDTSWGVPVQSGGRERGFQSFAFHPQFGEAGTPGYGKFYTYSDTENTAPTPDFSPGGGNRTHDTVLLEWTASDPTAATYDGDAPRELMRFEQPFPNHNAGQLGFNPTAAPGDSDFGMLYMGVADGGSGGDPLNLSQNLSSAFGKIFRIDPLGSNSANGEYGIPSDNPFASDGGESALGEIYAYGVRNPQRFAWDPRNGNLFLADIGQNTVEELSLVTGGANLGWNVWEGSFRFVGREGVSRDDPRGDPNVTYPVAEYDQDDPLLQSGAAASGVHVHRRDDIPQLANGVIFGDNPSGEIFYVDADDLPDGGQDGLRRVLFNDDGEPKNLLQLIQEKNEQQDRESPATRTEMRLGTGPEGELIILNKQDSTIRMVVP